MARSLLESLGLFAAPFILYALFLAFRARHPLFVAHWSRGALFWLTFVGLGLAIAGLVWAGLFGAARQGVYIPAHIDNGRLITGHFQ